MRTLIFQIPGLNRFLLFYEYVSSLSLSRILVYSCFVHAAKLLKVVRYYILFFGPMKLEIYTHAYVNILVNVIKYFTNNEYV